MKAVYTTELGDVRAFRLWVARRPPVAGGPSTPAFVLSPRLAFGLLVLCATAFLLTRAGPNAGWERSGDASPGCGWEWMPFLGHVSGTLAVVAFFLWWFIAKMNAQAARGLADDRILSRPTTVTIDAEGVSSVGDFQRATVLWGAFREVAETDGHLFLVYSVGRAVAVPRRAFSSDAEFRQFADTARRFWEEAKAVAEGKPNP
jgi:hypothetical protein